MLLRISTLSAKTFEEYHYDCCYCEDILGFMRIYLAFEDFKPIRDAQKLVKQRLELNRKTMKGMNYGKPY